AYRSVDARVRSAVAKFGDVNRRVLGDIAGGRGLDRWQAQGITDATMGRLQSIDWSSATAETGAAAFWYVRNALFFEQGLDQRGDVALCSYDAFVNDPEAS